MCCEPLLLGHRSAASPLALMRSRFCAFHFQNAEYLWRTYASSVRSTHSVSKIQASMKGAQWVRLEIEAVAQIDEAHGSVSFAAYYQEKGETYVLRENSLFVKEEEGWRYLRAL